MKLLKLISAAAPVVALTLLSGVVAPASKANVSFDFFYSDLSPHGHWLVSAEYGHVWQPAVYRHGWNPYYDGHWEYTEFGWTWVSDYDWGDVPYHYGTWVDDPRYGWAWVPGYTWAPAWVTFRTGPDYIGWAPVAPGFSVGFSTGEFSFGASVGARDFVFVPTRYFAAPRLRDYYVPETRRTTIIHNTTIVNNLTVQNNIVVNQGPDLRSLERATGRRFRPEPIERVRHATPFTSLRREELAVSTRDAGRVRAAEPVSAERPLPPRMSPQERRAFRSSPQVRLERARRDERVQAPMRSQPEAQLRQPQQRPQIEDRSPAPMPRRSRLEEQRSWEIERQQDLRGQRQRQERMQEQRMQEQRRQEEQGMEERRRLEEPQQRRVEDRRHTERQPDVREQRQPEQRRQQIEQPQRQRSEPRVSGEERSTPRATVPKPDQRERQHQQSLRARQSRGKASKDKEKDRQNDK